MPQTLLFLAFSLVIMSSLLFAGWYKKVDFKTLIGLFLFGIFISTPFILIEYLGIHLKFYIAIMIFILTELAIIYLEHRIKYFHDLIHHNVKHLRFLSFFLIGIGFTFSEISFTIFHSHGSIMELLNILPLKTTYALLMHTVLTSAASLTHIGNLFTESLLESVFKFMSYYTRITLISISHYLYIFSMESKISYVVIPPALIMCTIAFFWYKKLLDKKAVKSKV